MVIGRQRVLNFTDNGRGLHGEAVVCKIGLSLVLQLVVEGKIEGMRVSLLRVERLDIVDIFASIFIDFLLH